MAAASPEFYKPPAFSPRLHLLVDAGDGDDDEYFRTPKGAGISYLGDPGTCPPAPRKPRPPPGSTCRKRLFDVDVISLRFDDLDAIFRPSKYGDNKQKQQRRRSQGRLTTSGRSK